MAAMDGEIAGAADRDIITAGDHGLGESSWLWISGSLP
jgi:hypothetical protein